MSERDAIEQEFRRRWINAASAHRRVQQSAGRQRDVADDLALDAETGPTGEQAIIRITHVKLGADAGGLAVSSGGDDEPVNVFYAPRLSH